jgi:hypothetical protein
LPVYCIIARFNYAHRSNSFQEIWDWLISMAGRYWEESDFHLVNPMIQEPQMMDGGDICLLGTIHQALVGLTNEIALFPNMPALNQPQAQRLRYQCFAPFPPLPFSCLPGGP